MQILNKAASVAALDASVQAMTLERGVYLFRIRSGPIRGNGSRGNGGEGPSLAILPAPGTSPDDIATLSGPRTVGNCLRAREDTLVLKAVKTVTILLTSIGHPNELPLEAEVRRLDQPQQPVLGPPVERRFDAALRPRDVTPVLRPKLQVVDEQNRSDLPLRVSVSGRGVPERHATAVSWVGNIGSGVPMESFSILPLAELGADQIEYKALTSSGIETPWIAQGQSCAADGGATLIGFAVRIKPQRGPRRYDCTYRGAFLSGKKIGPFRNGMPCVGLLPDDPLEAIQVSIVERASSQMRASQLGKRPALNPMSL